MWYYKQVMKWNINNDLFNIRLIISKNNRHYLNNYANHIFNIKKKIT